MPDHVLPRLFIFPFPPIGSELIFIVLKLSMDCQRKRILARHGEVSKEILDIYVKAAQIHEPAGADKENTFGLEITENDS